MTRLVIAGPTGLVGLYLLAAGVSLVLLARDMVPGYGQRVRLFHDGPIITTIGLVLMYVAVRLATHRRRGLRTRNRH